MQERIYFPHKSFYANTRCEPSSPFLRPTKQWEGEKKGEEKVIKKQKKGKKKKKSLKSAVCFFYFFGPFFSNFRSSLFPFPLSALSIPSSLPCRSSSQPGSRFAVGSGRIGKLGEGSPGRVPAWSRSSPGRSSTPSSTGSSPSPATSSSSMAAPPSSPISVRYSILFDSFQKLQFVCEIIYQGDNSIELFQTLMVTLCTRAPDCHRRWMWLPPKSASLRSR